MTDIEQKALALIQPGRSCEVNLENVDILLTALTRAIERHEAFRQEVSDACVAVTEVYGLPGALNRFIITKPDPLVDAIKEASQMAYLGDEHLAHNYRAAIEKRGGKIVWEQVE